MTDMTHAQTAQQNNRDNGGKYATKVHNEAGDIALVDPPGGFNPDTVAAAIAQARETGEPVLISHPDGFQYDDGAGGCTAGDYSISIEPSVRATWATGRDDEPFISCTETAYVTAMDRNDNNRELDYDDLAEAIKANAEARESGLEAPHDVAFSRDFQTGWSAHTDLDDVGGSEVRADYEHQTGDLYYYTVEDAEAAARNSVKSETFEDHHPEYWN